MKSLVHLSSAVLFRAAVAIGAMATPTVVQAQEAPLTAKSLSDRLSSALLDNASSVRLKIEINPAPGGGKSVLQLQVKSRRTKAATDILYQVLWPKERKGESFVLRKTPGRAATGSIFTPPDSLRTLTAAQMQDGIFGSNLAYEDLVDNFYAWDHQELAGTETVNRVQCQVLESKPGKGDRSSYSRVRSWIDVKKMVPLRIEKYGASGQLIRRINTTRVAKDDTDRQIPASFAVQRGGQESVTELEGSNIKHDVTFSDADFAPEALRAPAK